MRQARPAACFRLRRVFPAHRNAFRTAPECGRVDLAAKLRARVAPAFSEGAPGYDPCHDIHHLDRVARTAAHLARAEKADERVVTAAAYLHDLDRTGAPDRIAAARAELEAEGVDAALTERILEAVDRHKDKSFAPGGVRPASLEARVLSDADKLEAIGAIGIARAFSFGGLKGRPLWAGAPDLAMPQENVRGAEHPWIDELSAREKDKLYISGAKGATIDHFFEKLLRLRPDFATEAGKRMAEERHAFLRTFLTQFFDEWNAAAPGRP